MPPRPWRLIWILLGVVGIVALAGGGVVLGMSAASSDEEAEESSQESTSPCDEGAVADEAARLCYVVPDGWIGSSMGVGVGPTSTVASGDSDAVATAHFGPVSSLPIMAEADLSAMVETVTEYACELFDVSDCSPNVAVHDLDGHEAITATAGDERGYITVTVVEIGGGYSYVLSIADEAHRADTDAIHGSLRVI